jgi:hypothetical protein
MNAGFCHPWTEHSIKLSASSGVPTSPPLSVRRWPYLSDISICQPPWFLACNQRFFNCCECALLADALIDGTRLQFAAKVRSVTAIRQIRTRDASGITLSGCRVRPCRFFCSGVTLSDCRVRLGRFSPYCMRSLFNTIK